MYAHTVELPLPIDQAIEKLKAALAEAKMGVVSEVDVQAIMKAKINHEIPPYRLLGVCAPGIAKRVHRGRPGRGRPAALRLLRLRNRPGVTRIALQDPGTDRRHGRQRRHHAAMNDAQSHLAGVLAKLRA
jgi:uncharacterized protein (DUF302 family)